MNLESFAGKLHSVGLPERVISRALRAKDVARSSTASTP
jgi:hypothetical protein